eukprot:GHVR01115197.1.p2 GENE.GHVR01115197.1~~GHVR01115197.1.p2  ORF type:complete len:150 (+),score=38.21 GHVR01115197.1:127-576(+)
MKDGGVAQAVDASKARPPAEAALLASSASGESSVTVAVNVTTSGESSATVAASAVDASGACSVESATPPTERPRYSAPWRIDWATLLKRVWDVDSLACPCGGRLKFIEVVTDAEKAKTMLERAGLSASRPPVARARSPDDYDELPSDWD